MRSTGRRRSVEVALERVGASVVVLLLVAGATCVSASSRAREPKTVSAQATAPSGLRIVGSAGETPPVVNEGGRIRLAVVDEADVEVEVERWSSDSPGVARVTGRGFMKGRLFGYATISAATARGEVAASAIVVRVAPSTGNVSRGDTEPDATGAVYLSSPDDHVVWRSTGVRDRIFVGRRHVPGFVEGVGKDARLHSPSGLSFDARQGGGLIVADAENHVVRLVRPEGATSTLVGSPMTPGRLDALEAPATDLRLDGPRGVVVLSGDLVVSDTNNHQLLYLDRSRAVVSRLAGIPGQAGYGDGEGLEARFSSPTGLAASPDGTLLAVADPGNNQVRILRLKREAGGRVSAVVSTVGVESAAKARGAELVFRQPQSVAFDPIGNLYVIDAEGASVVTNLGRPTETRTLLAQPGTFRDAASVAVRGARAVVLDAAAVNRRRALLSVTVGPPEIEALSRTSDSVAGGATVTVDGANFSPEAVVTLGDARVESLVVESARRLTFVVPRQGTNAARTLSVRTRGGLAQREFEITPIPFAQLQPGTLGTVGGTRIAPSGDGGSATGPGVEFVVTAMTTDAGGSVLVGDNARVRRVDAATGVITTVAGTGVPGFSGDGGPAILAQLAGAGGLASDESGAVFISDSAGHRVRRVDPLTGTISTIAGTGEAGFSGDGGQATDARLDGPGSLAVDAGRGLLVADTQNHRIRRIDLATGTITTVAGNGSASEPVDGQPALASGFASPANIAVDRAGRLYVSVFSGVVWRVDMRTGLASRFAGTGIPRGQAEEGMRALDASIPVAGLAATPDCAVLISDFDHPFVWRIDPEQGLLERFAGNGSYADGGDRDIGDGGPARRAGLRPSHLAVDGLGGVLIDDESGTTRIRRVDPETGLIATIARQSDSLGLLPGRLATSQPLSAAPAMGADGTFYATSGNYVVTWSVDDAVVRIVAGSGSDVDDGDGGPVTEAGVSLLSLGVVPDPRGGFALITSLGGRIRHVDPGGTIRTVAGTGEPGNDGNGGSATDARIDCFAAAIDSAGVLYFIQSEVASSGLGTTIRRVDLGTGRIEAFAGSGDPQGPLGDGGDARDANIGAFRIAIGPNDDVYIADTRHRRIRRIDRVTRIITTVAGNGELVASDTVHDGQPATAVPISVKLGFAFDLGGRLIIGTAVDNPEPSNTVYRCVRVGDGVLRVVSEHASGSSPDGTPLAAARLSGVNVVGVLGDGSLVVAERFVVRVLRGPLP